MESTRYYFKLICLFVFAYSCASDKWTYQDGDKVYLTQEYPHSIRVLPSVFGPSFLSRSMREYLANYSVKPGAIAADIGTGSGIYAYILADKTNITKVYATDINPAAIETVKINAKNFNLENKIKPTQVKEESKIFSFLPPGEKLDIVILNPPWEDEQATSMENRATNDKDHIFLKSFLKALPQALSKSGEAFVSLGTDSSRAAMKETIKNLALNLELIKEEKWKFRKSGRTSIYKLTLGQSK